jgi:DNA-binding transcriptional LysR family regulator
VDLQDLRTYVEVCQLRSFTKAAVHLGVSQPTVSRIISQLEGEWGGSLFYRTGRGVSLSEFGEQALARARDLLQQAEQFGEDLRGLSRLPSGVVSVTMPPSVVSIVVPELLNQLRADRPGIHLLVHEGFSEQNERSLAAGTIDIGLYSKYWEGETRRDGLLLPSRLVLAGAPGPLPAEIDFDELGKFPMVLPLPNNGLRAIIDSIARRMKVTLNVVLDADSTVAQKQAAARCGCFMIKAPHTIAEEQVRGEVVTSVIRNPYINRHVVLVTSRQKPLSRAARDVADRMTQILRTVSLAPSDPPRKLPPSSVPFGEGARVAAN